MSLTVIYHHLAVVYLSHFCTGSLFSKSVSEFTRGFSEGKMWIIASAWWFLLGKQWLREGLNVTGNKCHHMHKTIEKRADAVTWKPLLWKGGIRSIEVINLGENWGKAHSLCRTPCLNEIALYQHYWFKDIPLYIVFKVSRRLPYNRNYIYNWNMWAFIISDTLLFFKWDCSIALASIFLNSEHMRDLFDPKFLCYGWRQAYSEQFTNELVTVTKSCLLISCQRYEIEKHKNIKCPFASTELMINKFLFIWMSNALLKETAVNANFLRDSFSICFQYAECSVCRQRQRKLFLNWIYWRVHIYIQRHVLRHDFKS